MKKAFLISVAALVMALALSSSAMAHKTTHYWTSQETYDAVVYNGFGDGVAQYDVVGGFCVGRGLARDDNWTHYGHFKCIVETPEGYVASLRIHVVDADWYNWRFQYWLS